MKLRSIRIGIILAAVCAHTAAAFQDSGSNGRRPGKGDEVVARGCLSGPTLQSVETVGTDDSGRVSEPLTYQLKGNKKTLARLREEHEGNVVSITGVLRSTLPHDGALAGTTAGRTKITFGVGTPSGQKGAPAQQPALPVLDVRSYESAGTRCAR
jgi:hypothetical protein